MFCLQWTVRGLSGWSGQSVTRHVVGAGDKETGGNWDQCMMGRIVRGRQRTGVCAARMLVQVNKEKFFLKKY